MRLSVQRLSSLLLLLALSACADGGRDTPVLRDSGTVDAARDAAQAVDAGEDLGALPDLGDVDSGPFMCVSDELCDDGVVCNGEETCEPEFGCAAGEAIPCDDGVACTVDSCTEPSGECAHAPVDADADRHGALGCTTGDDCDDTRPDVYPGAVELCDGRDNDCNDVADDGATFDCVLGSAPVACTTTCGTPGTRTCSPACALGVCAAAAEVCGNNCDDNANGDTDEGCPTSSPVNDTCAGAILLTGASGTRTGDTINGAVANTTDCSSGLDVFYRVDVAVASVIYVDTFGSSFDTVLSYRGTACPGTASRCNDDDDCGSLQEQIGVLVPPGSHYFAVHAFSTSVTTGSVSIRWQTTAAPAGNLEVVDGSGSYSGTTSSSAGRITPTCGGGSSGYEHAYYWFQCPGTSRTVSAHTCYSDYDTTLSIVGPTGTLACNDDSSDWLFCSPGSELSGITTSGAGFFAIFVDAYDSSEYGTYVLSTNL